MTNITIEFHDAVATYVGSSRCAANDTYADVLSCPCGSVYRSEVFGSTCPDCGNLLIDDDVYATAEVME